MQRKKIQFHILFKLKRIFILYLIGIQSFLDEISCVQENRTIHSCGSVTDPTVPNTLNNYMGVCACTDPVIFSSTAGPKIGKQLFDNRVKPDVFWNLLVCSISYFILFLFESRVLNIFFFSLGRVLRLM